MAKTELIFNAHRGPWGCKLASLKEGANEVESATAKKLSEFQPFADDPLLFIGPYVPSKSVGSLTNLGESAATVEILKCSDPHRLLAWVNAELAHDFPRPGIIRLCDDVKRPLLKAMSDTDLRRLAALEYKRKSTDIETMQLIEARLLGKTRARTMRG